MSFTEIFMLLVPVFGLLGLGWLAATLKLMPVAVSDALGTFAATIALPALLFHALAKAHFPDISPWPFWIAYFTGVVITWGLGDFCYQRLFGGEARIGIVAGVSSAFSNTAMLGIPIVFSVYGKAGDVPLLLLISVHLPIMTVAATILFERIEMAQSGRRHFNVAHLAKRIVVNIVKNPIVIGIFAGAVVRALGISIEGPVEEIVVRLSDTAVPCALFALGMSLKRYGLREHIAASGVIVVLKLVVMPAIVFVMSRYVMTMPPIWSAVATVSAASATGVNAYLIANRAGVGLGLASNAITVTSAAAAITIGIWLGIIGIP